MPGVGSAFLCARTDGHWWKPASLMARLTHISDWPMHVAYWGTQWLLNTSWLDPVRAIDSTRSQHVDKAGHLVMTAPLRPPASSEQRGARPPCATARWPDPVFCQLRSRVVVHLWPSRSDSQCRTSILASGRVAPGQATRTNYGTRPGSRTR